MNVLLDNCIINGFFENHENFEKLLVLKDKVTFYICPSTIDEFSHIKDTNMEKRIISLCCLFRLEPKYIYDSICVPDYSRFDLCAMGNGEVYDKILSTKEKTYKHIRDAIIADTAVANDLYLLTEDNQLYKSMKRNGFKVLNIKELLATL